MSNNKYLLVLERSEGNLAASKDGDKYVLEGVFTEIGVKNKNNRIYDERELMPHINELKEKLKGNKLLGELDHPKSFDISLKNASHVIEDINYDPSTKKVMGRIRLLNTDAGKQAMALVDAGVPLHISSRAAGVVENDGHVKIKKMFTYDLVADPGFANAELKRVNEAFGFDDDDTISIYETNVDLQLENSEKAIEDAATTIVDNAVEETEETNKSITEKQNNAMDPKKYITVEDFNEYTKIVKNEFAKLEKSLTESKSNENASVNEGLVKYTETVAKRVNQVQEYVERLAESVDGLISHNDYIIENLEKVKNYAELVGEKTSQGINYGEKLAESVDHLIEYTRLVAEKADQGIEFTKYVANESNNRWKYQSYMNEQLDNVISHNDYIVEGTSSVIEYTEYLKEQTENLSNYMNHIVEQINEGAIFKTEEKVNEGEETKATETTEVNEGAKATEITLSFEEDLTKKIDSIVEAAKAEKQASIVNNKLHFLNFISESKRNQFASLNPEVKDKVIAAFEGNKFYGSVDAERIYESIFLTEIVPLNWLNNMPEKYKATWNGLNESQKTAIKAQASVKVLDSQYKIDDFWATRDLRDVKVELNESTEPIVINESAKYESPAGYMETVEAELKRRFKR
jgi:hypothetical protein